TSEINPYVTLGVSRVHLPALTVPYIGYKSDNNSATDDKLLRDYGDALYQRSAQRLDSNIFLTWTTQNWNVVGNLYWYQDLTTPVPIELNRLPEITVVRNRTPIPCLPGFLCDFDRQVTHVVRDVGPEAARVHVHSPVTPP